LFIVAQFSDLMILILNPLNIFYLFKEIILVLCCIIMIFLFIYTAFKIVKLKDSIVQNFKFYKIEILKIFIISLISALFIILLNFLFVKFLLLNSYENKNQESLLILFKNYPLFLTVKTVIFAPITEEFVYRYLIFRFINNPIYATIFSTFFFSALHVFLFLN
jgi:membrane protease YdiL (CAAX protease family)